MYSFQIDTTDVGWSLGFMLVASNDVAATYPHQHLSLALFIIMLILFAVFIGISVLFGCVAIRQKQKRSAHHRLPDYGSL